jgi:hypothetical protein
MSVNANSRPLLCVLRLHFWRYDLSQSWREDREPGLLLRSARDRGVK